ncbi:hypothetical protein BO70DRAFT_431791 [Aspergillus heteromorphus CBS 117.55]|uniref:A to I editase domain-containing protein n=1 Tax=Aspergillus heteromorphus CBS 117.55 TaxID=1448321 RepID=A0A317VHA1_9EURO|nr:uncharacterized protein BO70DRAFT_431791 [Aspergillus heteromorphus CBS 117.55]PWY72418.1 hypothetical protein BO70DRAFT_431791 [Aspergillus heteromorphus CBS 117.55]
MEMEMQMDDLPARIARLVHSHFDGLPTRSKPILRDDGTREWIPMSGIVVVRGENTPEEELTCVAVTSGAKCLSASQIPHCKGLVLHDWHAEILALRAFNYWLLGEVRGVIEMERSAAAAAAAAATTSTASASAGTGIVSVSEAVSEKKKTSPFVRRRPERDQHTPASTPEAAEAETEPPKQKKKTTSPPFELHPSLKIYMYCTCAPCGDASMELTMAAQEDPTPWEIQPHPQPQNLPETPTQTPQEPEPEPEPNSLLNGRAHFSQLGIVRRKPARADASSTKSKSCSDKLALRQVSSLISRQMGLLVAVTRNAYLAGLVMPEGEISAVGCGRAFGGGVGGGWGLWRGGLGWGVGERDGQGYRFSPFQVLRVEGALVEELWAFGKPRGRDAGTGTGTATDPGPANGNENTSGNGNGAGNSAAGKYKPGTISAVWIAAPSGSCLGFNPADGTKQLPKLRGSRTGLYETIIGGVKQGYKASGPGPRVRGASALSRAKMWGFVRDLVGERELDQNRSQSRNEDGVDQDEKGDRDQLGRIVGEASYGGFKKAALSTEAGQARERAMQDAKKVLVPWVPNSGDEGWGLEVLVDNYTKKRKR